MTYNSKGRRLYSPPRFPTISMAPPSSLRSVRSTRARAKSDALPPSSMPVLSTPSYSHVSSYRWVLVYDATPKLLTLSRSLQMELLLYSPYVKVVPSAWSANHTLPVFGGHDVVGGKVILDPSCQSGRLTLSVSSCCHSIFYEPNTIFR